MGENGREMKPPRREDDAFTYLRNFSEETIATKQETRPPKLRL